MTSKISSGAERLLSTIDQIMSEYYGFPDNLFAGVAAQPQQLQPRVMALVASLHKLSRSPHPGLGPLGVLHAPAAAARRTITVLYEAGVPDAIGRDLRTWRCMLAPYVVIIGRYCWEIGRWLQQWQQDGLQRMQHYDVSPSIALSRDFHSRVSDLQTELRQIDRVIEVLQKADWLVNASIAKDGAGLDQVQALWDSCCSRGRGTDANTSSSSSSSIAVGNRAFATAALFHKVQALWSNYSSSSTTGANSEASSAGSSSSNSVLGKGGFAAADFVSQWQKWHHAIELPAYGCLDAEFHAVLHVTQRALVQQCLSLALLTEQQLEKVEYGGLRPPTTTSSSSSSSSSGRGSSAGDSNQYPDAVRYKVEEWVAAKQQVSSALHVSNAMHGCLELFDGFAVLGIQLQEAGAALCAKLPLPWLCNNPGCMSVEGASELQLVGGRSCVCGGCKLAR
jgi:hypothetical protein